MARNYAAFYAFADDNAAPDRARAAHERVVAGAGIGTAPAALVHAEDASGDDVTHRAFENVRQRITMEASRQFSFRLPKSLVDRVEDCADAIRANGLEVTRADVVRLLLNHALETTGCRIDRLLRPRAQRSHGSARKGKR